MTYKNTPITVAEITDLEGVSINAFIENLPGYKAQNLTLNFMISFLFVISATVIGVFLY
jgi:putative ABC transport system permease protein